LADRLFSLGISNITTIGPKERADLIAASPALRRLLAAYERTAGHELHTILLAGGHGDLRLTLSNRGEVLDSQLAATPQEANRVAIMMIASRDAFDIGDVLTCHRTDDVSSPEPDAFDLPLPLSD
jgi:hypothetical protein